MNKYCIIKLDRNNKLRLDTEFIFDDYIGQFISNLTDTDMLYIGGNGDFFAYNQSIYEYAKSLFEKIYWNIYINVEDSHAAPPDEYEDYIEYKNLDLEDEDEVQHFITDWITHIFTTNVGQWCKLTNKEMNELIHIIYDATEKDDWNQEDEDRIVQVIFSIINKEPFIVKQIYGDKPYEEVTCICPKKIENVLPSIASLFFDNGEEYLFLDDTFKSEQECDDFINSSVFSENSYTRYYCPDTSSTAKIRVWAADILKCQPSQIIIRKI